MNNGRPRVLIADDETFCRRFLKSLLVSMDFEVVAEAQNGIEALALFKEKEPHITILDIAMPLKRGDEVLEELKRDAPDAFVIVLTAVVDLAHVERCLGLGAANYIRKDTPLEEIKQIIMETWQEHSQNTKKPSAALSDR
jgi:two-component system chemotaxis response regulator CheY